MKKSLGKLRSLYPSVVSVLGVHKDNKTNFINITHSGIIGQNLLMFSMKKIRFSASFLSIGSKISVNVIDEDLLNLADYFGMISGANVDKSKLCEYEMIDFVPVLKEAKVCMICKIIDDYETKDHHQWVCEVEDNLCEEEYANEKNLVDFTKFKPVLFDNENWIYLQTGKVLGKCCSFGKAMDKK